MIVAEGFDYEIIDKAYRPFDNMSLLVLLKSDGSIEKKVVASVTESLKADPQFGDDWSRLREIFCAPSLQMVSFTITFMPDAPQRNATDTSQKLSIRFGETIKAYQAKGLNMDDLALIPLVLAGYARYLKGVNDEGEAFTPSPDPLLAEPQEIVAALEVKEAELYAGPGAVRKTLHKYVSAR